jgi:hypothetical protein
MRGLSRRPFGRYVVCGSLASLAGCQTEDGTDGTGTSTPQPPPIDRMEMSIFDLRKPDVGLRSTTIPIILEFLNPTERPIPSPSGELDVFINGNRALTSEPTLNTLEPGETATKEESLIVRYEDVGGAIVDALRDQQFEIRLSGAVRSDGVTDTVEATAQYP